MTPTAPGLSIIIPVYNEKHGIAHTLAEFEKILGAVTGEVELIVVNDGSTDGTGETLRATNNPRARVHHHAVNRGYGAALKTGIRLAKYDCVAITDADGTYPNQRIPEFYRQMQERGADMLVGARVGNNVNIPWLRRFPKWVIGQLANFVAEQSIPDLNSGLRLMRKEVVEKYLSILPDGFSFTTTITLAMLSNDYTVRYEAIDYHARKGSSKIRPIHDTLNFVQLILRTAIFFDPLRIFTLAGLFLWACGLVTIVLGKTVLAKFPHVTVGIFALGGIQIICLGLIADLINRKFSSHK